MIVVEQESGKIIEVRVLLINYLIGRYMYIPYFFIISHLRQMGLIQGMLRNNLTIISCNYGY